MTARRDPTSENADQIAFWNAASGETWVKFQRSLDLELAPLGRAAIDALAPRRGERIIDVGCGCGQTTLELARRLGEKGAITGIDVSGPMLRVAEATARGASLAQARFVEADAQTFAFPQAAADAAFSRFGVMFFADPVAAFTNLRAALAPGGRLAFICWRDISENPFMTLPFEAAAHLLGEPQPATDPSAPGPFAFADPDRLHTILAAAGFTHIDLRPHDDRIGSGDLDQSTEVSLRMGPLGRALREQPHLVPAAREAVREALTPHLTANGVLIASASWIVTARNGSV
ncbi:MAG TPA: methyltransferase domain-containing protein [Caulobacteraceae bacterium]